MPKPSRQSRAQEACAREQFKELGEKEGPLHDGVYSTNVPPPILPSVDESSVMDQSDHESAQKIFTEGGGRYL